ncbi:MAG: T9SS C-terminal target domain-containing protein, partial [Bacteroidia bacterium]|nr:T9SS C-terminal target domain-containing protein [Bacteroidia bacterium]
MKTKLIIPFLAFLLSLTGVQAKEMPISGKTQRVARTAAACLPSTSSAVLDVNNVRCMLHNGGDMWWDLVGNPRYEVPKVDNPALRRHSSFAASLWIGGLDASGQLRIAAQTYRQDGNDFWPGPLSLNGQANTDDANCKKWDQHFKITKAEIDLFRSDFLSGNPLNFSLYPNVKKWPGTNTDPNYESCLAPFVDVDGNFVYNPEGGDYPDIKGDQAIWWVINDKGNIHTATGGEQIGIEIQMLAFAFSTSNAVNNMTFYSQRVINRSTLTINQCYISQWADVDIGNYADDYVGCDVKRGLGFAYNGDPNDDGAQGYGINPPALGVDFFQGPLSDPNDGIDNDNDGTIDEITVRQVVRCGRIENDTITERIGMAKFVYYENDFSLRGNPTTANHYYQYMTGFWKDGAPIVFNFKQGKAPPPGPVTNYMYPTYPGNLSACSYANPSPPDSIWSEATAGNTPFDRRFLISAGPFTLKPGAVNEIVVGVVWARGFYDDQFGSVCELLAADDIAQALFDADFKLLTGPDAPDLNIVELDKELIINWKYDKVASNNYYENYAQKDPVLGVNPNVDAIFEFQGYLLYQLADPNVGLDELENPDRARLIAQCDIKDGISTIVNRTTTLVPGLSSPVISDKVMVQGKNEGLFHSIRVTEDKFTENN